MKVKIQVTPIHFLGKKNALPYRKSLTLEPSQVINFRKRPTGLSYSANAHRILK